MDNLAHQSPALHHIGRKRKAAPDDHRQAQDKSVSNEPNPDPMALDIQATPRCPTDPSDAASSSSWMLAQTRQGMPASWAHTPSPAARTSPPPFTAHPSTSGPPSPKRLRIEIPATLPGSPRKTRRPHRQSSRKFCRHRRPAETRDTGIVSATEPGPSSGSLLPHLLRRTPSLPAPPTHPHSVPASPVEPFALSPHIPPHQPPINRETLKELNLDAILRNPQLRHDLLFDSGLQFRPTSGRRKRDLADNYWLAIVRELECACTCTTVDVNGRITERRCICRSLPMPVTRSLYSVDQAENLMTVRTPSRIPALLNELLEVLVSIIQPSSTPAHIFRPPELFAPVHHPSAQHPQAQQNVIHVALLRSLIDADLIRQEVDHGLFDPSGVFQAIGDIIRCHCAPMRDTAVEQMVKLARSCASGGTGSKLDAVRAIRMCFEIMELMKLDVANHQLQTLRPYLVRTSAEYELKTFQESRKNGQLTLDLTRSWLKSAYQELLSSSALIHSQPFLKFPRQTRVLIALTRATVNLIFDPPSPTSSPPSSTSSTPGASPPSSVPPSALSSPTMSTTPLPLPLQRTRSSSSSAFPETLYLDGTRLLGLSADGADFTALYMLLMLYRQLVHSQAHRAATAVQDDDLLRLKKEIWEIGPAHPGQCFMQARRRTKHEHKDRDADADARKWRAEMDDVVLQVARRAGDPRRTTTDYAPPQELLALATSWAESNLRAGSPLSALMKRRVRARVEEETLALVLASSSTTPPPRELQAAPGSGLEPLMPELKHMAERTAKLVAIHMNVYGALYAQPAFLGVDADGTMPLSR